MSPTFYEYQLEYYGYRIVTGDNPKHYILNTSPNLIYGKRKFTQSDTIYLKDGHYGNCIDGQEFAFTWNLSKLDYKYSNGNETYYFFNSDKKLVHNDQMANYTEYDWLRIREYEPGKYISHACEKELILDLHNLTYYPDICDDSVVSSLEFDEGKYKYHNKHYPATGESEWIDLYTLYTYSIYIKELQKGEVHKTFCQNASAYDGPKTIYVTACGDSWEDDMEFTLKEGGGYFTASLYTHSTYNNSCSNGLSCIFKLFYPYVDNYVEVVLMFSTLLTDFTESPSGSGYYTENNC